MKQTEADARGNDEDQLYTEFPNALASMSDAAFQALTQGMNEPPRCLVDGTMVDPKEEKPMRCFHIGPILFAFDTSTVTQVTPMFVGKVTVGT